MYVVFHQVWVVGGRPLEATSELRSIERHAPNESDLSIYIYICRYALLRFLICCAGRRDSDRSWGELTLLASLISLLLFGSARP